MNEITLCWNWRWSRANRDMCLIVPRMVDMPLNSVIAFSTRAGVLTPTENWFKEVQWKTENHPAPREVSILNNGNKFHKE